MNPDIIIECPKCEWQPDGKSYWRCSCGCLWNTFETRGKCPKCNTQWENTYCPACGSSTKHETWYKDLSLKTEPESPELTVLRRRKQIVESRLIEHGIRNRRISHLPYLEFREEDFQEPYEVGYRLLILWAISYTATNTDRKERVESWLKETKLWERVSDNEKILFKKKQTKRVLAMLSWRIEAVVVLCWCVGLLEELPPLNSELPEDELEELNSKLPIGKDVKEVEAFLRNLKYRDKEEIFLENIVNEMATSHFRDGMLGVRENESDIDTNISFERHQALNWVRKFSGISEWDDTDTST